MASWSDLLTEINKKGSTHDIIRRKYLKKLSKLTKRNTIAYYSGWLQKPNAPNLGITDSDKNGFMNAIYKLDCKKGLDLILHTPGGETAATESIVDYLRQKFGENIRAIVPQLAMSGGTMMACAASEIIMGKQSSLGPIDPQFNNIPAHGIIEEFNRAIQEVSSDPKKAPIWQVIVSKYGPALLGECQKSIDWSEKMVRSWLKTGMFKNLSDADAQIKIDKIISDLGSHALTLSHFRHLSSKSCHDSGLKIIDMESDQALQNAILTVHHSFMLTFEGTPAVKIIENQNGNAHIQTLQQLIVNK